LISDVDEDDVLGLLVRCRLRGDESQFA
jgi:hypothetical protein